MDALDYVLFLSGLSTCRQSPVQLLASLLWQRWPFPARAASRELPALLPHASHAAPTQKPITVPSPERLKHVNAGQTAVRTILESYYEYTGLKPTKQRPVMILTEDIQMLKEQLHLHFGSTWETMTKKPLGGRSTFAARITPREKTGTHAFLAAWDALPAYVSKVVSAGKLERSLVEESPEEHEEVEEDAEVADAELSLASSACSEKDLDLAVNSWERAHQAKEGKLGVQERAVCKELMSSCFERCGD